MRDVARILRTSNFDQSLGRISDRRCTLVAAHGRHVRIGRRDPEPAAARRRAASCRDVADVVYEEPPLEYGRHLDGDFAIGVSVVAGVQGEHGGGVRRRRQARSPRMNERSRARGRELPGLVQPGQGDPKTLRDLTFTGIFGALLAALVLFVFLRRVSTTMVAVMCIPFSLIVTCGFIWARGESAQHADAAGADRRRSACWWTTPWW